MAKMRPTIWIFALEQIQTRYTAQWYTHIPKLLNNKLGNKFNIVQVDGIQKNTKPTTGAFLNFSDTNYWKSSQLCNWLDHYNNNEVTAEDQFLFTDAWNPAIIQIKYMNDLLGHNWKLHGLFHAGNYDPGDFLGRILGDARWVYHTEQSIFHALDYNYFATNFHIELFARTHGNRDTDTWVEEQIKACKIVKTGWPMEYMESTLAPYKNLPKRNLILFPHRIAPEKQVEIFRDLSVAMPQYEFVVCQDKTLSKHEYHTLLGESKIVFSASKQETLGIVNCSEGPLLDSIPLCPNRLSYSEIFEGFDDFLYPSEWTNDWNSYLLHKDEIINNISHIMENYDQMRLLTAKYIRNSYKKYFESDSLISTLSQL